MDNNLTNPKRNHTPRKGWDKQFKKMHKNGDDNLLMPDVFEEDELLESNFIKQAPPPSSSPNSLSNL